MIDLTPIFQAIIALLAAFITYKVIPWVQARTTSAQQETIRAAVRVAVFAAEQLYGAGKGAQKLDYAFNYLHRLGYDVDRADIEAAVSECFNYGLFAPSHPEEPPDDPDEE